MNRNLTITFKDKASSSIDGLIISDLPQITKPEMRVDRTEIDGRPGDIVDELGYATYTKTVNIGLARNYDIDAIAKYFSGEGSLILSDEPNRRYNARVIAAVDYAKLINFRTAEVEFEIQPYKYLVGEIKYDLEIDDEEALNVTNAGLEESKPLIRLEGEGTVAITVNGMPVFSIDIDDDYVIIDSEAMDAYITGTLKNDKMTGLFPALQPGLNVIGWTGTLTRITVEPRSRWL